MFISASWRIILTALLLCLVQRVVQCSQSGLLEVNGFRVRARVLITRSNSNGIDRELVLNEYYSNRDRRARLDIKLIDRLDPQSISANRIVQYHYQSASASSTEQLIRLTNSRQDEDCKLVDKQELVDELFGKLASVDEHISSSSWLKERQDVPNYFIGLARMLIVVEANKIKMNLWNGGNHALIRNQQSIRYVLRDPLGSDNPNDEPNKLTIYYAVSQDHNVDIPLRIWYVQQKTNAEITVEYLDFSILSRDELMSNDIAGIFHDHFMLPVSKGCSSQLSPVNLLAPDRPAPRLVSFRMNVAAMQEKSPHQSRRFFIAYDGYANALRRDELTGSDAREVSVTTIYDFCTKRIHNIRRRVPSALANRLIPTKLDNQDSQCVVAHITPDNKPSMEPLIPFKELTRMGLASVRGMEAVAFEHVGDTLPEIFLPRTIGTIDDRDTRPNYSVTYYFSSTLLANNDNNSGSPLRLDDEQLGSLLRIRVVRDGTTQYVADIEEFLWQLADAPNGDRSTELFALKDGCFASKEGRLRADSLATINLDLVVLSEDQKKPLAVDELYSMLNESTPKRNKALVRALNDAGLAATQIYDLESRVYTMYPGSRLGIRASAKLSYQNQLMYEATGVGFGVWRLNSLTTKAKNYDDCLWDAMHESRNGFNVLFTFCYNSCRMDKNAKVEREQNGSFRVVETRGFTIAPHYRTCQIFYLSQVEDDLEKVASPRALFKRVQRRLRHNKLKLPLPYEDKLDEMYLTAQMVQIGNNRWFSGAENNESGDSTSRRDSSVVNEQVLVGVGLSTKGGATIVQPKPPDDNQAGSDGDDERGMSYSLCHSTCLARIDCRSFSICTSTSGKYLECVISELEFRDPNFLAQIRQELDRTASIGKPHSRVITLQQPLYQVSIDDASEPTVGASSRTVELRVDRRCRLYNKQALELFHQPTGQVSVVVRNRSLLAVDSEEECAEICIGKNTRFFRGSKKRRFATLNNVTGSSDDQQAGSFLERVQAAESRSLRSWCHSFGYIDLDEGNFVPEKLSQIVDPFKLSKNGLCYLARAPVKSSSAMGLFPQASIPTVDDKTPPSSKHESTAKVYMRRYEFVYSSLYEPQYGTARLFPFLPDGRHDLDSMTPDELRLFMRNGNSQAVLASKDVETCARYCFLQNAPIQPWCQSFGFLQDSVAINLGNAVPRTYCVFNSNTLQGARRSQMADKLVAHVPENLTFNHYEPRNPLDLDGVILEKLLSGEGGENKVPARGSLEDTYTITPSSTWILITISFLSGLALAHLISPHLVGDSSADNSKASSMTFSANRLLATMTRRQHNENNLDLSSLVRRAESELTPVSIDNAEHE